MNSLKERVLDKLAGELAEKEGDEAKTWKQYVKQWGGKEPHHESAERAVVLALATAAEELKQSADGCVYALKNKNTEKGLCLSKEDEIRVEQSLFLYKEWARRLLPESEKKEGKEK